MTDGNSRSNERVRRPGASIGVILVCAALAACGGSEEDVADDGIPTSRPGAATVAPAATAGPGSPTTSPETPPRSTTTGLVVTTPPPVPTSTTSPERQTVPPIQLTIGSDVANLAVGTSCWRDRCGDAPGVVVPHDAVSIASGESLQLTGGVASPDVQQLGARLIEPGDKIIDDIDVRIYEPGPLVQTIDVGTDHRFTIDAPPGTYLLEVNVIYVEGSGAYAVEVDLTAG